MAFVVDSRRRTAGAKPDIATSSALRFRQLATTEWRRLLRRSSHSSRRSSAASKLPARRMALISRANYLRSLSGQRLGAWRIGCAMQVSTGDVSVERRPGPPVEIPQGHPSPWSRQRLKEPPPESLAVSDPAGRTD